jgi:hypothetical protein
MHTLLRPKDAENESMSYKLPTGTAAGTRQEASHTGGESMHVDSGSFSVTSGVLVGRPAGEKGAPTAPDDPAASGAGRRGEDEPAVMVYGNCRRYVKVRCPPGGNRQRCPPQTLQSPLLCAFSHFSPGRRAVPVCVYPGPVAVFGEQMPLLWRTAGRWCTCVFECVRA